MTILLILPWPDAGLSPNSRSHWRVRATRVATARLAAKVLTLDQAPRAKLPAGAGLAVTLVFCRPGQRKRDMDNLIASCKAYQDGVADALGFNDSAIRQLTGAWGEPVAGDRVEMRIDVVPA